MADVISPPSRRLAADNAFSNKSTVKSSEWSINLWNRWAQATKL